MASILSELLFPISKEEFILKVSERKHHHFANSNGPQSSSTFLSDLNRFCGRNDIAYPAARMVYAGTAVPLDRYYHSAANDARCLILNTDNVFSLLTRGNTLIVQPSHTDMNSFSRFASELINEFCCDVDLSVFITPAHSIGLKAHYDTSSAFIFQIYGEKRWRLYSPYVQLPSARDAFTFAAYRETELLADITLREGERLYIPRGMVHEPSSQNSLSIHMTISLELQTYAELLRKIMDTTPGIGQVAIKDDLKNIKSALANFENYDDSSVDRQ